MSHHSHRHPEDYFTRIEPEPDSARQLREDGLNEAKILAQSKIKALNAIWRESRMLNCTSAGMSEVRAVAYVDELEQELLDKWEEKQ